MEIVAAADFDGDGRDDLLWRQENTGQVYLLLMRGSTVRRGGGVYHEPDVSWTIVGPGTYAH